MMRSVKIFLFAAVILLLSACNKCMECRYPETIQVPSITTNPDGTTTESVKDSTVSIKRKSCGDKYEQDAFKISMTKDRNANCKVVPR